METKDIVYLGLIAFAGLVFYLHGYYAGATVMRGKLTSQRTHSPAPTRTSSPVSYLEPKLYVERVGLGKVTSSRTQTQTEEPLQLVDSVRCFFGNN